MHLASQGHVVLAVEHRDGTGPAVFPLGRPVLYVDPNDVEWPDEGPTIPGPWNPAHALRLRDNQLDFRRREVYEAVRAFTAMIDGSADHGGLVVMNDVVIDWES
jgi:platelet-activating factor acetylhydrolase